jgi:hypothetical protein
MLFTQFSYQAKRLAICLLFNLLRDQRLPVPAALLQVFSRAALAAAWAQQPLFLKQQLALWVKQQQRHVLDSMWPQLLQQAAAAAAGSGAAGVSSKAAASQLAGRTDRDGAGGKKRKKSKPM